MSFNSWELLAMWLQYELLKNYKKMNLEPILNKNSPWAHIKLDFEVLGVTKKLVKYVIHLSKNNN
jgi:hypothetical protein